MSDYNLLIDGKMVPGDQTMPVLNPATEEVLAQCPRASKAQLDAAVAAAKAAFPAWAATPMAERRELVNEMADVIEANSGELAHILTSEQGKPLGDATGEVLGMAAFFRYLSSLELPMKVIEDSGDRKVEAYRRPLGVVGAIIPWNYPLLILSFKLPSALLAGNTLVVKPAPTTPLATLCFAELIKDVLPKGVLNFITDANDLGGEMTKHPDIRKISFTGSSATGQKVMASAAQTLKRITLELGGNDAGIVLDDVDPKKVAPGIFEGAFQNSGQVCLAIKRLYVHESVYDELCNELVAIAKSTVVDDGAKQGTKLGPLQNKMQYEKVKTFLEDARKNGKVVAGGSAMDRPGYFIEPTIVRDIQEGSKLVDEEQFGPVLPLIKYSDKNDAIRRANATTYGLGASVWSSDIKRAHEVATQLESGTVWINKHLDMAPHIPFGGAKQSGIGTEFAEEGLAEFTQLQIINGPPAA
ncbi:aldehyde dehydrogenase family protein [Bradyrhizobium barranii subsp. barranii]|uniref:Aldehyde dehydrogenase family protein n=1 Tax=Bradyrhizobium barranii subsp. barranii TaxID=2823807 RepID=A0A7Z0QG88_9BRAD|nr:aldehyde dehydrogenase family protein [Bradyrhizobium barranii]UGX90236.1 aldehyde dehydrogenase family protein [Bradyrhizobium barranii subsp. barranii]